MKSTFRRRQKRRSRKRLRLLFILLCICLLAVGIAGLVRFHQRAVEIRNLNQQLAEVRNEAPLPSPAYTALAPSSEDAPYQFISDELLPAGERLLVRNPDTIGWLEIPDILSLPVVYRDNDYYLTHNFDGEISDSGTLFLDAHHPLAADSQYLVIHGHAMHDGSMFGALPKFQKEGFPESHAYLYFDTLYRREIYHAVAVLEVSEEEMYTLMRLGAPTFLNEAEFALFAQRIEEKAMYLSGDALSPSDSLLALSTCWNDGRIVVLYRRV